jgi:hypothetical protein
MRNGFVRGLALLFIILVNTLPSLADDTPVPRLTMEPVPMLSTTELSFGRVPLRSVKSMSFDIANQGADTLVITSMQAKLGLFDVSLDSTIRLAQDSLLTVQVNFSPDVAMKVQDQLVMDSNAGELTIDLLAVAFELWPLAWRIDADSTAWFGTENGLCSMAYNPVTHHLLALNKNADGAIYLLDPDHGQMLGKITTPLASDPHAIAVTKDGQIFLATLAPAGTAFTLFKYADERSAPIKVFEDVLSGRTGDALAVTGSGAGIMVYVSGIGNTKIFTFHSQDGSQYRRSGDIVLPETGAAGYSISATAAGDYLFIKAPGKSARYIRTTGEQVHKFEAGQPSGTGVHYFTTYDETGSERTFLAACNGFTPGTKVLELLGQPGDSLCNRIEALAAPTPTYANQSNSNATAQVLYIGVDNLLLEMTTNNGLSAYRLDQIVHNPQVAGGVLVGRVKDAATWQPLVNAEVLIQATDFITTTDDSGTFAFTDVPAGLRQVQVSAYNYFNSSKTVFVPPGGMASLDFLLKERSYLPISVSSYPQGQSAVVEWDLARPQQDISYHNKKPTSGWFQKLGRAYGAVFDLSSYPGTTLEQVDFNHYAWQVLHGPFHYRVHILNWRDSTEVASFDGMTTHDSYAVPKWEMAIDLGGLAWMPQVGIFIEPLSGTEDDAHPALSTDDNVPIQAGTNFIIEDINDPFNSAIDCHVKNPGMGNFLLDLWINPLGQPMVSTRPLQKGQPSLPANLAPRIPGETRGMIKVLSLVDKPEPAVPTSLRGFNIYRVNSNNPVKKTKLASVTDNERSYVDASAPADSSYSYAISAIYDSSETSSVLCSHHQPQYLSIAAARQDNNKDFVPDLLSRLISLRGVVSIANLDPELGSVHYLQDSEAGILLKANHGFNLEPGDEVFAFGWLRSDKGLCVLDVDHVKGIQLQNKGGAIAEKNATAASFDESLEGMLVRLNGFKVVNPGEWPLKGKDGKVRITNGPDTIVVRIDKDLDMDGSAVPGGFFNIAGIVGQNTEAIPPNQGYELWPRSLADFRITTSVSAETIIPLQYDLAQNYPNPFNPITMIAVELPQNGYAVLEVLDLLGKSVATIYEGTLPAGHHRFEFQARNLASGSYFYRLRAGSFTSIKKMIILR